MSSDFIRAVAGNRHGFSIFCPGNYLEAFVSTINNICIASVVGAITGDFPNKKEGEYRPV
jgi:hypothetical protein